MRTTILLVGGVLLLAQPLAAQPAQAAAQSETPREGERREIIYTREVFHYDGSRRADPFRSLLGTAELGIRPEDLTLVGVIYSTDPRASVAVFLQRGSTRRVRARVGDRIGSMTIAAIYPRRADVVVNELGVARRETLQLRPVSTQAAEGQTETESPEQ
jgi:hypothetical protein